MSCFLDILRCIFCCEDDERSLIRNNTSHYDCTRLPDYGSYSRTIYPTTDSPSRKQFSFERTASTGTIQQGSCPNLSYMSTGLSRQSNDNFISSKLPEIVKPSDSATLSGFSKKNSTVISHNCSYQLPAPLPLPNIPSTSSVNSKPTLSSTSKKLDEGTAKWKASPSANCTVQTKVTEVVKPSDSATLSGFNTKNSTVISHNYPYQLPASLSLPKIPSTSSVNSKPTVSSTSNKLDEVTAKGKASPTVNCTVQTKVTKIGTNKTIDQKLPHDVSSAKVPPRSIKPTLSPAPSSSTSYQKGDCYIWEDASPTYVCPDDIKSTIEKDIVPGVLKKPVSVSTYREFFQALLYAEDIYLEKWEGFEMKNVTLQLQKVAVYGGKDMIQGLDKGVKKVDRTFVAFEVDKIPERRPFLLSRDFVTLRPLRNKNKTFQGIIYRVIRSNLVLAEFEEDFHRQHDTSGAYDVSFSFNRVCLKRAHQAILTVSDNQLRNFVFPNLVPANRCHSPESQSDHKVIGRGPSTLRHIFSLRGSPPYLVQGPLSNKTLGPHSNRTLPLSETGVVIVDTIIRICCTSSSNRILLCAPANNTCDVFIRALKKKIPESDMFRANAAFRELDGVPEDILPSCLYKEEQECFSCPSLGKLSEFKVILSTFMSSFRLHNIGIKAGHFSHIFLVDASSAIEPEALVPLAHFANETTTVVITGAPGNRSSWVRSDMARRRGLKISYFERLRESKLYQNLDPCVITILESPEQKSNHNSSSFSLDY